MESYESYLPSFEWLSKEYYDLNGSFIEVLEKPPNALQFSRMVHISRPALIKGVELEANQSLWTNEYLTKKMGDRAVSVSVTPNGLADAVTKASDGTHYFVEPHVESMDMAQLLGKLENCQSRNETCYLQSQNGNLYSAAFYGSSDSDASEFEPLRSDVPPEISWCSEALDRPPDAVNLWIGNGHSVTSIHSDPYENVYTVVRGAKHFTLLPPSESLYLRERLYPHAKYRRAADGVLEIEPSPTSVSSVRWSSIGDPNLSANLSPQAHPMQITVQAGESLYLPAGWWHYVEQSKEETTIALNWWYDMEMQGMNWVAQSFLRGSGTMPLAGQIESESASI